MARNYYLHPLSHSLVHTKELRLWFNPPDRLNLTSGRMLKVCLPHYAAKYGRNNDLPCPAEFERCSKVYLPFLPNVKDMRTSFSCRVWQTR
jgi:hypothetical protein